VFPILFYAYKFLNPIEISERTPRFESQIIEFKSLYDFMEINEDMGSLIVKE
jgi:hypothetical protein